MTKLQRSDQLSAADFEAIANELGAETATYRKAAKVAAMRADVETRVATRWNGEETVNVAAPGDFVVVALGRDGAALQDAAGEFNRYVIKGGRFDELYAQTGDKTDHGAVYRARDGATIRAFRLPDGFDIAAPWGERQQAEDGYLILNGDEVYGNAAETFRATYEQV